MSPPRRVVAAAARLLLLVPLLWVGLAGAVAAQLGAPQHAKATLYSRVEGASVRVAIEVVIDRGWHLYHEELGGEDAVGLPTRLALRGAGIEWSRVRFPEPHRQDQSDIGASFAWVHEGTIVLYALGRLGSGASGDDVGAEFSGLTCQDDGSCIPVGANLTGSGPGPDALFAAFPADLVVPAGGARPPPPPPGGDAERADPAETAAAWSEVQFPAFRPRTDEVQRSLLGWLLLALLAGALLNVMPCVLPVISIKVLSFVQQAGEDRRRVFALGIAFAAGILVVFLALAGLAVGAGLSWGEQFQSQTFLVVMIGIVFALALSLFGLYELGVPAGVGGLAAAPPREGLADAFFKGMLATALATPCSGPFLGSTLTWTLGQPAPVVFAVFAALGLGMALPYVFLTANPALLRLLPRPGAWMETFKQAMGFLLLATVVYLMISLRQDLLLFTVTFLVFVGLSCWAWGRFGARRPTRAARWAALVGVLLLVAAGGHLSFRTLRGAFAPAGDAKWVAFEPRRFVELLRQRRSVFVDFTADWCPNCDWNEKWTYESDAVQTALAEKGVVSMKADITHADERTDFIERFMTSLGGNSIPFMAVFPGDRPDEPIVRLDLVRRDDLLAVLASLPDPLRGP